MLLSSVRKSHSAVPIFYVSIYYFEQCRCMSVFRKIIHFQLPVPREYRTGEGLTCKCEWKEILICDAALAHRNGILVCKWVVSPPDGGNHR